MAPPTKAVALLPGFSPENQRTPQVSKLSSNITSLTEGIRQPNALCNTHWILDQDRNIRLVKNNCNFCNIFDFLNCNNFCTKLIDIKDIIGTINDIGIWIVVLDNSIVSVVIFLILISMVSIYVKIMFLFLGNTH